MIFEEFPSMESDLVLIRQMRIEDASSLECMVSEDEVYRFEPTFLSERQNSDLRDFIAHDCKNLLQQKSSILLGVYLKADANHLIGIAELYGYSEARSKISIGYRLQKEYWGKGIGTEVVALLKRYILNDLHLKRITAHVRIENIGSKRCLIKNGFVQRRKPHEEDWGYPNKITAVKYVYYSDLKGRGAL